MSEHEEPVIIQDAVITGLTATKHECPPDRVAMQARLEEITRSYTGRLDNQRQVIENLSQARQALLADLAKCESFLRYVHSDFTGDHALSERAGALLTELETP